MRIRRRLALYGAVVTAAAMFGFGLVLDALARTSVPEDQEQTLTTLATESAASFVDAPAELFADVVPLLATDVGTTRRHLRHLEPASPDAGNHEG